MAVLPQPTGEADPTKVTLRAIRAAEELSQALHHLHLPTGSMGEQAHTLAVAMAETTGNTCSVTETTGNTCTCPVTTGESCPVTDTHVPQVARVWRWRPQERHVLQQRPQTTCTCLVMDTTPVTVTTGITHPVTDTPDGTPLVMDATDDSCPVTEPTDNTHLGADTTDHTPPVTVTTENIYSIPPCYCRLKFLTSSSITRFSSESTTVHFLHLKLIQMEDGEVKLVSHQPKGRSLPSPFPRQRETSFWSM